MTKKFTIALILVMGLFYNLQAQTKFGLKGGLNLAKEKSEGGGLSLNSDNRVGLHAGIFVQVPISENLSIQPEFVFSQEGGKYDISGFEGEDRLDFINVPLLLRINPTQNFNLVLGPQFGILASAKSEINGNSADLEGVKSLNTSFSFGGGFNVSEEFEIYVRYNLGITNLNDDETIDGEIKLNTLQFGIAINFIK